MEPIEPSEITPERLYVARRRFLKGAAALATGALVTACGIGGPARSALDSSSESEAGAGDSKDAKEKWTSYEAITNYNNYYEFSFDKENVAARAKDLRIAPWTLQVGGLVGNPRTYSVEDLVKKYPPEERVYRFRCVEGWSMVIPWLGFPLRALLAEAQPSSGAKYVRFETLFDPEQMPNQRGSFMKWPYVEGLRLDEAMHDLTILATGLYGKPTLPQNGAPIRLVVPWKYGFKSIKSIVKIELVEEMPVSLWMATSPDEYGFYANVNPDVPHPRWSQATERRIGETGRRKTMLFNGYAEEVAPLYAGMDLKQNY